MPKSLSNFYYIFLVEDKGDEHISFLVGSKKTLLIPAKINVKSSCGIILIFSITYFSVKFG